MTNLTLALLYRNGVRLFPFLPDTRHEQIHGLLQRATRLAFVLSGPPPPHASALSNPLVAAALPNSTHLLAGWALLDGWVKLYPSQDQVCVFICEELKCRTCQYFLWKEWMKSKTERPHVRDGTPWAQNSIPCCDVSWIRPSTKTPETWKTLSPTETVVSVSSVQRLEEFITSQSYSNCSSLPWLAGA